MFGLFRKPRQKKSAPSSIRTPEAGPFAPPRAEAVRDTDADWAKLGDREPYFSVLVNPDFLRANMTEAKRDAFFRTGAQEIGAHLQYLRDQFGPFTPRSALDFGCGVGRLTRALADISGDAVGIDISDGMLREARLAERPGLVFQKDIPDRPFDWIVSIIVFQHIPPDRGYRLLQELLRRLAPGGCVTLQFVFYRDPHMYHAPGGRIGIGEEIIDIANHDATRAYAPGEMMMFDYDLTVIAAMLFRSGVAQMRLVHTDHGGFHGASVFGRRNT